MQCSEGAPARSKDRACGGVLRQINLVIIDRASALCRRLDDTDEGTDALAHVVNRGMVGRGQEFRRRGGHPQRPARRRSAAGRARALGTWVGGLINRCLVASPNASTYPAAKSQSYAHQILYRKKASRPLADFKAICGISWARTTWRPRSPKSLQYRLYSCTTDLPTRRKCLALLGRSGLCSALIVQ